jgi:hypothetical protein
MKANAMALHEQSGGAMRQQILDIASRLGADPEEIKSAI